MFVRTSEGAHDHLESAVVSSVVLIVHFILHIVSSSIRQTEMRNQECQVQKTNGDEESGVLGHLGVGSVVRLSRIARV